MKTKLFIGAFAVAVGIVMYFLFIANTDGGAEIEYRYGPVAVSELTRSISATGTLVPETIVDVKSEAGGEVLEMLVDDGDRVQRGDPIAIIDPQESQTIYQQAQADVTSAEARVRSSSTNLELQRQLIDNSVRDAENQVELAQIRLERVKEQSGIQPVLTSANIRTAEAALATAEQELQALETVQVPQRRRDAETNMRSARASYDAAKSELDRQKELLELGFVSQASLEQAESAYENAAANLDATEVRLATLEADLQADLRTAEARVRQAEASLAQAEANSIQDAQALRDLREAEESLEDAELALERAREERRNINIREFDVQQQQASAIRSEVEMEDALDQLNNTTVVAPRTGVVTQKYIEQGTVVTPGGGSFSEGTNIVQLSDTTTMFVETLVDEGDIRQVNEGQDVRITVEAYPRAGLRGVVRKVFPSASSENGPTRIRVRIEVLKDETSESIDLRPGMNANCQFLTLQKADVIVIPAPAVRQDGDVAYVLVRTDNDKQPARREIVLGEEGDQGVEVIDGLSEGEEVVTAEINLQELRERQAAIEAAEEGDTGLGG
ncbi:MAG: efflux RND transporter periplasmic adaptor subunit [Fimbriimonadaceae bacterium]